MPEFPGGELKLMNFLSSNIRYPEMERDNDIQGTVQVKFIVNTDGSVSDIVVVKSVSPALDNEAIRLVKMLPKFSPGKQSGKTVRVYQTIPVVFKLQ
jgi:TonB family protein